MDIDQYIITTDDLCLSYIDNFLWFDKLKVAQPKLRVVAFAIGNFRNSEPLINHPKFLEWWDRHKDWVEIAVHSYDHGWPPDGDRQDEKYWISKALSSLKPFLPVTYGYRSPGWQTTNKTAKILKELNFTYIAYETKIKNLVLNKIINMPIINSHLYDKAGLENLYNQLKEVK